MPALAIDVTAVCLKSFDGKLENAVTPFSLIQTRMPSPTATYWSCLFITPFSQGSQPAYCMGFADTCRTGTRLRASKLQSSPYTPQIRKMPGGNIGETAEMIQAFGLSRQRNLEVLG